LTAGTRIDGRCGTHAGVSEHRRRREPGCEDCRAYWRKYMAARRAREFAAQLAAARPQAVR
jgi:hypothetical protein